MSEFRRMEFVKVMKQTSIPHSVRAARITAEQDIRKQERKMKTLVLAPTSSNGHPPLKPAVSDPPISSSKPKLPQCRKLRENTGSTSKKPPFVVPGVVHHNNYFLESTCDKHLPPRFKNGKSKAANNLKLLSQHQSNGSQNMIQKNTSHTSSSSQPTISFASTISSFSAPIGLTYPSPSLSDSSEAMSDEVILSPLGVVTPLNDRETPNNLHLSPTLKNPWITTQRGWSTKKQAKEVRSEASSQSTPNWDLPKIRLQDQTLNETAIDEECQKKPDVYPSHLHSDFLNVLQKEDDRLKALCQEWDVALELGQVPATEMGAVFSVVGQAQLLQRERFKQFADLVDKFENKTGERTITATDLEGFWEMIYIQVEDVDRKFANLKELQANNWIKKEEPEPEKKVGGKKKAKSVPARSISAKSNIRAHIAAARKKQTSSKSPFKSPSFCVRLTPPLRSPNDYRRMSTKLAEELLNLKERQIDRISEAASNDGDSGKQSKSMSCTPGSRNMQVIVEDVVDSVFKNVRKKHNSARYFPSLTPQRPGRKRSTTADQIFTRQFLGLNMKAGASPCKSESGKMTEADQSSSGNSSGTDLTPNNDSKSPEGNLRIEEASSQSDCVFVKAVSPLAIVRQLTFYREENNNEDPTAKKSRENVADSSLE